MKKIIAQQPVNWILDESLLKEAFENAKERAGNFSIELMRQCWNKWVFSKAELQVGLFKDEIVLCGKIEGCDSQLRAEVFEVSSFLPTESKMLDIHHAFVNMLEEEIEQSVGLGTSHVILFIDNRVYCSEEYETMENRLHHNDGYCYTTNSKSLTDNNFKWFFDFGYYTVLMAFHHPINGH